ncbi:IPT/TIG domain-containing protein [Chloroflexota bacterium]
MKRVDCSAKRNKILRLLAMALALVAVFSVSTPALSAPLITLSPTSGAVGTKVTITGANFDSYKGDNVFIFFDNTEIASSPMTIPETGSFTFSLTLPDDADSGRHKIEVRSQTSSTSMLAESYFIILETEIKLDIVEGTVGTSVTVDGEGFYAEKMVNLYYYNRIGEKLGTKMAGPTGEFSYRFTVPESVAGEHRITVENSEGNSAEVEFEVLPSITLNRASGAPGDILTVSGNGFGYRNDVSIYFKNDEVAYAKTNEIGNFEVTLNIPKMKSGAYDVKIEDEDKNSDKAKFTITAGASLDKSTGPVGTVLTVSGNGFMPEATVTIKYDSLPAATAITDNNGAFSGVFNVPASTGGKHVVTVGDDTTTRQFVFTVESVAPSVPPPLLPADASETKPQPYFDWGDVVDPSMPVTYNLQIAPDQNFNSIVLEKTGLSKSEYTLAEDEKLAVVKKETPYYWRVKTIDSAGNEGEWSTPWSFYVAAPPIPALRLPETGSKAEAVVYFNWDEVTNASPPITYNLQVASDQNFNSIVLAKTGLSKPEYTLAEDEKLAAVKEEAPYYWRVKAIDSVNNESEWSTPWSFYVGFSFTPPGWLIYTLVGLGGLLIGFLAFWLGRKTAYYKSHL